MAWINASARANRALIRRSAEPTSSANPTAMRSESTPASVAPAETAAAPDSTRAFADRFVDGLVRSVQGFMDGGLEGDARHHAELRSAPTSQATSTSGSNDGGDCAS